MNAIREGIAANLRAIAGLQVSAHPLTNPTTPSAAVHLGPGEFDKAMARGLDELVFLVRLYLAAVHDIGAGVNLDEYVAGSGARSVKAAVESEATLGGACHYVRVTGFSEERIYRFEAAATELLGVEFRVECKARGN